MDSTREGLFLVPPDGSDNDDDVRSVLVAADAATTASHDAGAAAKSAAETTVAAQALEVAAHVIASSARRTPPAATAVQAETAVKVLDAASAVAGSSAATEAASDLAVASTSHAADLAQRRAALLRQAPLVAELHNALERAELKLHYQPMYSMETGAVVAVEALIRWQHPSRGLLLPAEFLDVAEGPLFLTPIGNWVLEAAVVQAASWQNLLGDQAPTTWVNVSCDQLGRRHLTGIVEALLSKHGLAAGRLGIEVTERQLATRIDDVEDDLIALRDLGVALAVDDFGTGYASLDYLRRFTFDEIKIDRSFVSGLGRDRTDTAITSSIIALGRSLDLTVVAEGVETEAQYDFLKRLGCSVSQGYLLHRPAPPETIDDLLAVTRG